MCCPLPLTCEPRVLNEILNQVSSCRSQPTEVPCEVSLLWTLTLPSFYGQAWALLSLASSSFKNSLLLLQASPIFIQNIHPCAWDWLGKLLGFRKKNAKWQSSKKEHLVGEKPNFSFFWFSPCIKLSNVSLLVCLWMNVNIFI